MSEEVSRRSYAKYAGAGIVVVAIAGVGAYYATRPGPAPPTTLQPTTTGPATTKTYVSTPTTEGPYKPDALNANIDWKQFEGEELNVISMISPITTALSSTDPQTGKPLVAEFEDITGIKTTIDGYGEAEYYTKLMADLSAGSDFYDIFVQGAFLFPQYTQSGWVAPLEDYMNDETLTDKEWFKMDDIFPLATVNSWGYLDEDTLTYYAGPPDSPKSHKNARLYGMVVSTDIHLLWYRTDVFDKFNMDYPDESWTWEDYYQTGMDIKGRFDSEGWDGPGGKDISASMNRGKPDPASLVQWSDTWHSYVEPVLTEWGWPMLNKWYRGFGTDDWNWEPNMDAPGTIAATEMFARICRDLTGPGYATYDWPACTDAFSRGLSALYWDDDIFAYGILDPEQSQVIGKLGWTLNPMGPETKERMSKLWLFNLCLNSKSRHKKASWLFMHWFLSPEIEKKSFILGKNYFPIRASTFTDPDVIAQLPYEEFWDILKLTREKYAMEVWAPSAESLSFLQPGMVAVENIRSGLLSAEDACAEWQKEMVTIHKESGKIK
jgi:ABC-type glycerol-3-phosphate transport system substrate-binding protein